MPQAPQVFHGQVGGPGIVRGHTAEGFVPQILAEEDRGHLLRVDPELLTAPVLLGDDQHPVHLAAHQQLYHRLLLPQIRPGVAQHEIVAPRPGAHLRVVRQLCHELIVNRRHYQTDQLHPPHDHGAGHIVFGVAHLVAQAQDPLPGLPPDLWAA